MTFHTGLFVREQVTGDDIVGTSPVGARIALGGLFQDHGTLWGLPITGTTGWAYRVGAGAVALTRGSGDGSVLVGNDAPMDVPTTPAPGTGSRWDRIWVRQNDVDAGDENNQVVGGCHPRHQRWVTHRAAIAGWCDRDRPRTGHRRGF
ncbi:hypothetical protein [Sanguibacter sp. Z1732]|uniref:hypothetical protein n=1 Tax=Sanguibacter sp. Z1732 TaxID=3435412 RepID=UPI003D9CB646